MQIIKTIKTNWRDVVIGIALTLGLALGADILERMGATSFDRTPEIKRITSSALA